jgi:type III pantothenate kinase
MNLLVDSGNTSTKLALCEHGKIRETLLYTGVASLEYVRTHYKPSSVIISSVNKSLTEIRTFFSSLPVVVLDAQTPIPFANGYETPATLGMDRLAAVAGAQVVFPEADCLCIDAGTCITYDFIDKEGQYLGGGISPGIEMRFKALNTFTARLPLIQGIKETDLLGKTTEGSIRNGVQNGILHEVEGFITAYKTKYQDTKVIITGGDARFFESRIKETIFVVPELLFLGLNRILEYNV